jgi:hypothetical protein
MCLQWYLDELPISKWCARLCINLVMWDMKGDLNLLMRDMKGNLTVVVLVDFLQLQYIIAEVVLQPGVPDDHKWTTKAGGVFSF